MMSKNRKKIQPQIKSMVKARDGHCCINCGNPNDLTIDHLTPISRGGRHHSSNMATLCQPCNRLKADMTLDEFADMYERVA